MNIQTEHLEDHRVKFTVEFPRERLDEAKKKAARNIAKQVRIPGFRKGKAPYRILIQNGLEPAIVEDAVEALSQTIYGEVMEQADIEPYGPGVFENYEEGDSPTFIYTVPLRPVTKLGDYRSVRRDYEEPVIDAADADEEIEKIRQSRATRREVEGEIEAGHIVLADVYAVYADDPPVEEADEDQAEADEEAAVEPEADAADEIDEADDEDFDDDYDDDDFEDEEDYVPPAKGETCVQKIGMEIFTDPDTSELLVGFNDELIGAKAGDEIEFELVVPGPDDEGYEEDSDWSLDAGRRIQFNVLIAKVEEEVLPELDDEFAAELTAEQGETLTMDELRQRVHDNMQARATNEYKDTYITGVVDEIVEMSEFAYPPLMVEEQIDSKMDEMKQRLSEMGISFEMYTQMMGGDIGKIRETYREEAEIAVRRMLALGEIVEAENLTVKPEQIEEHIDEVIAHFMEAREDGDESSLRALFNTPDARSRVLNDILNDMLMERLILIAKGEEIPEADDEIADEVIDAETDAAETTGEEQPVAEATVEADYQEADVEVDVTEDQENKQS